MVKASNLKLQVINMYGTVKESRAEILSRRGVVVCLRDAEAVHASPATCTCTWGTHTIFSTSAIVIQPFLQPQLSVEPLYELLRRLVHVELLHLPALPQSRGRRRRRRPMRDLHAPPSTAAGASAAHPRWSRRLLIVIIIIIPPAAAENARGARWTAAAAELVLQRRQERRVRVTWTARDGLVVAHHGVVQRLPYVLPSLHHVLHVLHHLALRDTVLYEEAY